MSVDSCIALAVFCEIHGPALVFCTQPVYTLDNDNDNDKAPDDKERPDTLQQQQHRSSSKAACSGCTLGSVDTQFITQWGDDDGPTFISGRYPFQPSTYSLLRQACVQSLSCEFCPGREGPILFGDDTNGCVLSYLFKIRDSQARGFQRWYSLLFMGDDKSFLVASWPFLIRAVAGELYQKAEKLFGNERVHFDSTDPMLYRQQSSFAPSSPEHFLRRRGNQALRSLPVLTDTSNLAMGLHSTFAWTLKAYVVRVRETHAEGRNMSATFNSDLRVVEQPGGTTTPPEKTDDDWKLAHLESGLGHRALLKLLYQLITGDQVVIVGFDRGLVSGLVFYLKQFLPSYCCQASEWGEEYVQPFECNLLGVSARVALGDASPDIVLELKTNQKGTCNEMSITFHNRTDDEEDSSHQAAASNCTLIKDLQRIMKHHLSEPMLRVHWTLLKENWLNKAKIFYKFVKSGHATDQGRMNVLMKSLNVSEGDLSVLRFWIKGIGVDNRRSILRE
ncbi:vesicle coat protein [Phlyctochytrium arcticum]|nr:vesicle coat protein [Phlyctochytrium arcticum]